MSDTSRTAKLTVQLVDDVSKPARSVAQALAQADKRVREIAADMSKAGASDRLTASLARLKTTKADIASVAQAWQDYAKKAALGADASKWTRDQVLATRQWERDTLASVRAVARERGVQAQAERAQLRALDAQREASAKRMHAWFGGDKSLAASLGAMVVGEKMIEAGKKAAESAADIEQLRFRIRELSRNDPSEASLADRLAGDVSAKYPGITTAKALDTYTELRANSVDAKGRVDPAIARRNLMAAADAQNAALALGFEMTPTDMQNLLKGVEGSGRASDPKAVEKITDAYIRAKQVFGSAIASSMVRDYTANAKSANFSIGDDQFYLSNFVRMSEGNASRLGNEVNQTLATMVGGHMTKATGAWMVEHGLARADQIVKTGPGTIAVKGGLKDEATLQTDQRVWAATTLRKSIEDSGAISEANVAARADMLRKAELARNPTAEINERFLRERAEEGLIAAELAKTGMRSTVTDNLAHFIGNQRLIERDIAAMQNASGRDAGQRIGQNPIAAFAELTASISNFGATLASPAIAKAGPILDTMARGIASVTATLADFQKDHPALATALGGAAVAGAVGGGTALTYGALNGLMTGFGLSTSATALSTSAAELSAAAVALKGGAAAEAAGAATPSLAKQALTLSSLGPAIGIPLAAGFGAQAFRDYFDPNADFGGRLKKAPYSFMDEVTGGASLDVDDSALDKTKAKAAETKAALDPLSQAVTVPVDTSSLDAAIAKANQLRAALAGIGNIGSVNFPSLGRAMRGNFTSSGQSGE